MSKVTLSKAFFTNEWTKSPENFKKGLDYLAPIQIEAEYDDNELHHHPGKFPLNEPRNYPIALAGIMYILPTDVAEDGRYIIRLDEDGIIIYCGPEKYYSSSKLAKPTHSELLNVVNGYILPTVVFPLLQSIDLARIHSDSSSLFIGIKEVKATPMSLKDFKDLMGDELPEGTDVVPGYMVEYSDGGKPNHPDYDGYISWSPANVFGDSYRLNGSLGFAEALFALKRGARVARTGWNANNQWVTASNIHPNRVASENFWSPHNKAFAEANGGSATVMPCLTIKNAQDAIQMGWVPSQGDLFAEDWYILTDFE